MIIQEYIFLIKNSTFQIQQMSLLISNPSSLSNTQRKMPELFRMIFPDVSPQSRVILWLCLYGIMYVLSWNSLSFYSFLCLSLFSILYAQRHLHALFFLTVTQFSTGRTFQFKCLSSTDIDNLLPPFLLLSFFFSCQSSYLIRIINMSFKYLFWLHKLSSQKLLPHSNLRKHCLILGISPAV